MNINFRKGENQYNFFFVIEIQESLLNSVDERCNYDIYEKIVHYVWSFSRMHLISIYC